MKKYTLFGAMAFSLCLVLGIAWFVFRPVGMVDSRVRMPGVAAAEPSQPVGSFGETNRSRVEAVVIGRDNVQSVVETLSRPEEYWFEWEICYYYDYSGFPATREFQIKAWQTHGMSKIEKYQAGAADRKLLESAVLTARNVYIWGGDSESGIYTGSAGSYESDDIAHMPTYEEIAALPAENILEAALDMDSAVIFIRSINPVSGYLEEWIVSLDTGMLAGYRCLDGENLVFSAEITAFGENGIDSSVFALPTGLMPE